MRLAGWSVLAAAVMMMAPMSAMLLPQQGLAQRAAPAVSGGGLVTHSVQVAENRQQLTVIDPQLHVLCVYHIEPSSGQVVLKSVRNIHYDLQMLEFNTPSPQPRDIRALVEQK